ncbi:hypothetical protein GF325_12785 [Candidatus Bathyarchaeota archaeon]|nr:hypothetical protein [Candidatus Bathyarchaeota archaeon]
MPGGDGSGPNGMGPLTGRRLGYCAGYSVPGYMNRPYGLGLGLGRRGGWGGGFGRGRGGGMGWGRGSVPVAPPATWYPSGVPPATGVPPASQLDALKAQKSYIESQLEHMNQALGEISKRISELESNQQ